MRHVVLFSVLFSVAAIHGCGESSEARGPSATPSVSCGDGDDCTSGCVCSSGFCCDSDECGGRGACVDLLGAGLTCTSNGQCRGGLCGPDRTGEKNVCHVSPGQECTVDTCEHCEGYDQNGIGMCPLPCTSDRQCEIETGRSDVSCWNSDPFPNLGFCRVEFLVTCGDDTATICPDGYRCGTLARNVCLPLAFENGTPCRTSESCASGICGAEGVCVGGEEGDACELASDCAGEQLCSAAGICQNGMDGDACQSADDCAFKHGCNDESVCEQIPDCTGEATACSEVTLEQCGQAPQCGTASRCTGNAPSCATRAFRSLCLEGEGCYWTTGTVIDYVCDGLHVNCFSYENETHCARGESWCSWEPRCVGTPSCLELNTAQCELQPGCVATEL